MSSLGVQDVDFGDHGVIYITSDKERPFVTEWTKPATVELLRVLLKQFELFNNGKLPSKRKLYDNCSAHLKRKGYLYTTAQTENKWKSLKRRYLTKYEKMLSGKKSRTPMKPRQEYDEEVQAILKIERPSLKRDMDEISRINLNIPPGFSEKMDDDELEDVLEDEEDFEQYNNPEEDEYTQNDEKLVEMVLKGSHSMDDEDSLKDNKNNVFANNIQYLLSNPDDDGAEHSAEEKYVPRVPGHSTNTDRLSKEIRDLKRVVKRNLDCNADILKTQSATHEQLLICLDTIDKREEEKIELKKRKLEKQGELIQQIKIQNSLIAKLIQKLGNNSNNR